MRILSFSLLIALVTACSVESNSSPSAVDPLIASKVTGTYAVRIQLSIDQNVPKKALSFLLPKTIKSSSYLYRLAKISEANGQLQIEEKNCAVEGASKSIVDIKIKPETVQLLPSSLTPLDAKEVNGKVTLTRGLVTQVLGAELSNIATSNLPTNPKDPQIVDIDNDGHPGATSSVSGLVSGDIYFYQRSSNSYSATLAANGDFVGPIVDKTEQVILGTTGLLPTVLNNGLTAATQDVSGKNEIRFVKIADDSDCDAAYDATLFPR
jgi:hypothetical protein